MLLGPTCCLYCGADLRTTLDAMVHVPMCGKEYLSDPTPADKAVRHLFRAAYEARHQRG